MFRLRFDCKRRDSQNINSECHANGQLRVRTMIRMQHHNWLPAGRLRKRQAAMPSGAKECILENCIVQHDAPPPAWSRRSTTELPVAMHEPLRRSPPSPRSDDTLVRAPRMAAERRRTCPDGNRSPRSFDVRPGPHRRHHSRTIPPRYSPALDGEQQPEFDLRHGFDKTALSGWLMKYPHRILLSAVKTVGSRSNRSHGIIAGAAGRD